MECGLMQRFCGADLCALVAEDALRSVFPFTRFFVDLHVHGADAQALAAVNALILITVDAQKRKITHGLQKYCDRAEIFAECAVILKYKGKRNSGYIVKRISGEKQPKHNFLKICDLEQKQTRHKSQ